MFMKFISKISVLWFLLLLFISILWCSQPRWQSSMHWFSQIWLLTKNVGNYFLNVLIYCWLPTWTMYGNYLEFLDFVFQILVSFSPKKLNDFRKCPNFYTVKFCTKEEYWYHIVPGYYKTNIYLHSTNYSKLEHPNHFTYLLGRTLFILLKNRASIRYFEDYKVKMTLHGDHWRATRYLLGTLRKWWVWF